MRQKYNNNNNNNIIMTLRRYFNPVNIYKILCRAPMCIKNKM